MSTTATPEDAEMADKSHARRIRELVESAPPLTEGQAERLRRLLSPLNNNYPEPPTSVDVYFIRSEQGEIKIGSSARPLDRLKTLQTSNPQKLELIAVIKGAGTKLEFELHTQFHHLRLEGEWFSPGADLWAFIEEVGEEPLIPESTEAVPEKCRDGQFRCQYCGTNFHRSNGMGRKPSYCKQGCREMAYQDRRTRKLIAEAVVAAEQRSL
jgi:hypothetical protein